MKCSVYQKCPSKYMKLRDGVTVQEIPFESCKSRYSVHTNDV